MKMGERPIPQRVELAPKDPKEVESSLLKRLVRTKFGRYLVPAMLALSNQGCATFKTGVGIMSGEGPSVEHGGPVKGFELRPITRGGNTPGVTAELAPILETPGVTQWWRQGDGMYIPESVRERYKQDLVLWNSFAKDAAENAEAERRAEASHFKKPGVIPDAESFIRKWKREKGIVLDDLAHDETTDVLLIGVQEHEKEGWIVEERVDTGKMEEVVVKGKREVRDWKMVRKIAMPMEPPKSTLKFEPTDRKPTMPMAVTHFMREDARALNPTWVLKTGEGRPIFDPRVNSVWRGIAELGPVLTVRDGVRVEFHQAEDDRGTIGIAVRVTPLVETPRGAGARTETLEQDLLGRALTAELTLDPANSEELAFAFSDIESSRNANHPSQVAVVFREPVPAGEGMYDTISTKRLERTKTDVFQRALMRLAPFVPQQGTAEMRLHVVLSKDKATIAVVGVVDDPAFSPELRMERHF